MSSESAVEELFAIEGIMVAGRPGQVRLLVDQAVVDLDENDIVEASELPVPRGLAENLAQPVRVVVRSGARLLDFGAAEPYGGILWERGELFSLRTRRAEPPWEMSGSFKELERRFFAGYGVVVEDEEEEERS